MTFRTRFAPSPTGPLHLGHAFSALLASNLAQAAKGAFLLRIEDIDQSRSRSHWEDQLKDDLAWLGIQWEEPVLRQSDRLDAYHEALRQLWQDGLLYPCSCRRRDIMAAAQAPQEGTTPPQGPDGTIYPGTCRNKARPKHMPTDQVLRLDTTRLPQIVPFCFEECGAGPKGEGGIISFDANVVQKEVGDIVLARRDMGTSYHLSVVVDDAEQRITDVVRGEDLFEATKIHVVLQNLLGLPTPLYHHHRLIRDAVGKRLAKRDDARAIAGYRADGATPSDLRAMVGL